MFRFLQPNVPLLCLSLAISDSLAVERLCVKVHLQCLTSTSHSNSTPYFLKSYNALISLRRSSAIMTIFQRSALAGNTKPSPPDPTPNQRRRILQTHTIPLKELLPSQQKDEKSHTPALRTDGDRGPRKNGPLVSRRSNSETSKI